MGDVCLSAFPINAVSGLTPFLSVTIIQDVVAMAVADVVDTRVDEAEVKVAATARIVKSSARI